MKNSPEGTPEVKEASNLRSDQEKRNTNDTKIKEITQRGTLLQVRINELEDQKKDGSITNDTYSIKRTELKKIAFTIMDDIISFPDAEKNQKTTQLFRNMIKILYPEEIKTQMINLENMNYQELMKHQTGIRQKNTVKDSEIAQDILIDTGNNQQNNRPLLPRDFTAFGMPEEWEEVKKIKQMIQ